MKLTRTSLFISLAALTLSACGSTSSHGSAAPETPQTGPLGIAGNSIVRIASDATSCGKREYGSGFVIGKDLIATNAHVVAGGKTVMVDSPSISKALVGTTVYFDEKLDTAIVRVTGLGLPALSIGDKLADGSAAKIIGYPEGNAQVTVDGTVTRVFSATTQDIYSAVDVTRDLYEIAATINHGNSGGPLVDDQGVVHGLVFAKAPDKAAAYVLLPEVITNLVAQSANATKALTTKCIAN